MLIPYPYLRHEISGSTITVSTLYSSADGLLDVTLASTAITISNNRFSHHDKVMLLGPDDSYSADKAMKVTVAFNISGQVAVSACPGKMNSGSVPFQGNMNRIIYSTLSSADLDNA